jgi:hypothetical protein
LSRAVDFDWCLSAVVLPALLPCLRDVPVELDCDYRMGFLGVNLSPVFLIRETGSTLQEAEWSSLQAGCCRAESGKCAC